jgi:hypothetical protein
VKLETSSLSFPLLCFAFLCHYVFYPSFFILFNIFLSIAPNVSHTQLLQILLYSL